MGCARNKVIEFVSKRRVKEEKQANCFFMVPSYFCIADDEFISKVFDKEFQAFIEVNLFM